MITVVLPTHNERHTAGVLVWRLREVFAELGRDFRVIALDDASDDGTYDVLEPYQRVLPLKLLRSAERLGYAGALERLMIEALSDTRYPKRDGLLVMQADFTDDPSHIPELMRRYQGGADLVATRRVDFAGAPRSIRVARLGAGLLARPANVPAGISDPWNGFRLYRMIVLRRALSALGGEEPLMSEDGWGANLELLLRVAPHLRRWDEVDVPLDLSRRYRDSRFRAMPELAGLLRAGRRVRGWPGADAAA